MSVVKLGGDLIATTSTVGGTASNTSSVTNVGGSLTGTKGEPGNGIANVTFNADYTLTITMDDGTQYTTSSIRGEQGEQGIQGIQGIQGETGETPQFSIGTVTTLPAGSQATVTITGTTEAPILNIGIPEGQQGSQGEQGVKGDTGATPDLTIGTVSTLPAGSSATATITGTDEEPVLNLGIPQGNKGDKGDTGAAGTTDYTELTNKPTALSDFTDDLGSNPVHTHSQYLTSHQSLAAYAKTADLATVATSGDYDDLNNKPTIPAAVTEATVSGWGFTKNTGTYSKPSGGIPKSDLATAVQTSLGLADTALQSYTETDPTFTASAAHGITATDITNWNNKSTFSGSYNDLTDKPTIPTVPTKLSGFTDDLGSNPVHTHKQNAIQPITSKTFSGVLATDANVNTLRPFFRAIPTDWDKPVLVEYRYLAYVPGHEDYYSSRHEVTFTFFHTAQPAYSCRNFIGSSSYRPIYYNSNMRCVEAYKSIGHLVGINFYNKGNSYARNATTAGYERTFEVEIIRAENCTIEWVTTCDTVSSTIVPGYVADTTHGAINNFTGTTQGETHTGDANSNTIPTGYCTTGASTAAKSVTCTYGYRDDANYFPCLFRYANTASNATLSIATYDTTALPIYVNGARTSASNTFGAGVILFLYYNNAYWCYNDGRFPIVYNGAVTSVQDAMANVPALAQSEAQTLINRTTAVNVADANYTTYMARGAALNTTDTDPSVNGAISWTYG